MLSYYGNQDILKKRKTGFLSSRLIPRRSEEVTKSWIDRQNEAESCVVIGHHSDIEKEAFKTLLKGKAKIILVVSSSIRGSLRKDVKKAVSEGRLLIISPENTGIIKPAFFSAETRNKLIVFLSDDLFIAHTRRGGLLEKIISRIEERLRPYRTSSNRMFLHSTN